MLTPALRLCAVLTLALFAGGCDRFDDTLLTPPDATPPAASAPSMYVKGNPSVTIGGTHEFRAQPVDGAVSYAWSAVGPGTALVNTRGNARIVSVTGTQPGPAIVRATAYDAAERVLASGSREIVVVE
ncbi:MAG TPA: hypothetical protein VF594_10120 [Rubricoccaceae bacterium]|jgi:hypothetical protein